MLLRVEEGAVHVVEARADDDAGGVMLGPRLAGQAGKIRQLGERHVHAERAGAGAPVRNAPQEIRRQRRRVDEPREEQLWIEVGDDEPARETSRPLSVTTPTARPFSTITSRTGALRADLDAARGAAFRHRLRDRAHAADRMAPDAALAVHLAEGVVEEHIGGARRIGALIGADDAVEAVHRLDRIALEPAVEKIAGRLQKKVDQLAPHFRVEPGDAPAEARRLQKLRQRAPAFRRGVRRRLQHQRAEHIGDCFQPAPDSRRAARRRARRISPPPPSSAPRRS